MLFLPNITIKKALSTMRVKMCNSTKPLQLKLNQMKHKQIWEHQSKISTALGVLYM